MRVVRVAIRIGLHLNFVVRPDLLLPRGANVTHELRMPRPAVGVAQHVERNLHRDGIAAVMRNAGRLPVRRVRGVLRGELVVRSVRRGVELIEVPTDPVGPEIHPYCVVVALADVVGVLHRGDRLVLNGVESYVERVPVGRDPRLRRLAGRPRANVVP